MLTESVSIADLVGARKKWKSKSWRETSCDSKAADRR